MPDDVPGTEDNTGQNNDGGGDAPEWMQSIPEELRTDPTLLRFKDVTSLANSYKEARNMIGQKLVEMPQSEKDWEEVFTRLGRPESGEKYNLATPELPEGVQMNEEMAKAFREAAHKLGLSDKQAAGVFGWYWDNVKAQHEQAQSKAKHSLEEATEKLKTEYGDAFNRKIEAGERALTEFGSDEFVDFLKAEGLNDDPRVIRFLSEVGEKMMEDGSLKGRGIGAGQTPEEIEEEIKTLMAKPAFTNPKDLEHISIQKQVMRLREKKLGGKIPVA